MTTGTDPLQVLILHIGQLLYFPSSIPYTRRRWEGRESQREESPRQGRRSGRMCSSKFKYHLVTICSQIQVLPGQGPGGGGTQPSEMCVVSGQAHAFSREQRALQQREFWNPIPQNVQDWTQANESFMETLGVLPYHYPVMNVLPHSKMGIHSKNNNLFINKLGCNFSQGQLGTMHIFIIS